MTESRIESAVFAAGIMEVIYDHGPIPFSALTYFVRSEGFHPHDAADGMALAEASGLLSAVTVDGVPCPPNDPGAVRVALTDKGRATVLACREAEADHGNPDYN
jgi:hypothetical protein